MLKYNHGREYQIRYFRAVLYKYNQRRCAAVCSQSPQRKDARNAGTVPNMAKKKKKTPVDMNAKLSNGMYTERTKECALQGLLVFVFLCLLGVMSYIASMIPAGIFGVAIARTSTGSQLVYDIQNLINVLIGVVIMALGGLMFAKKAGENDALMVFQNRYERGFDRRYVWVTVATAVIVYIFIGTILNVDFIVGPVRYLGIFLCRAERRLNEGIKVPFLFRLISMFIVMAIVTPCIYKGVKDGYAEKMSDLENEEKEAEERKAALEAEAKNSADNK